MTEKILVLDFGGQYNQLIARKVREEAVFAEIKAYNKITPEEIRAAGYRGIIFTGGPNSVYEPGAPGFDPEILSLGIPILGICYGAQLMAYLAGGEVCSARNSSEYGKTVLQVLEPAPAQAMDGLRSRHGVFPQGNPLFRGLPAESICWMSHTDFIKTPPKGFQVIARTPKCSCAAMCDEKRKLYGVQFHPEVAHTVCGRQILCNFLFEICSCSADWRMEDFVERSISEYRRKLSGKKVLLALSGGVDSSVAAVLLHRAIGQNLTCVFVDHGLLRKDEGDFVEHTFREKFGMKLIRVNAGERFLQKLAGVIEPEQKRRIIGEEFIRVFEEEARKLGRISVLAQGTIYPDVVESGQSVSSSDGEKDSSSGSAVIKSHHNVGGLPDVIDFEEIVEPLRDLFKDEVRKTGTQLDIPRELVWRQPFPGPGLAVRMIGEVTREKLELLREADAIFREEIERAGLDQAANQYFAVLTDLRSVGVMGDARTYGCTVALRAVTTDDFMTAEWTRLPYEVLEAASSRITNEVKGISRVVYDITSKPPATVEWE